MPWVCLNFESRCESAKPSGIFSEERSDLIGLSVSLPARHSKASTVKLGHRLELTNGQRIDARVPWHLTCARQRGGKCHGAGREIPLALSCLLRRANYSIDTSHALGSKSPHLKRGDWQVPIEMLKEALLTPSHLCFFSAPKRSR